MPGFTPVVIRVDVLCECEACAKHFGIEIDTSQDLTSCTTFEEIVCETVLGGNFTSYTWGVRGKRTVDRFPLSCLPTIQGGYLLCDVCSKKCDDLPIDRNLTREEVENCLMPEKDLP